MKHTSHFFLTRSIEHHHINIIFLMSFRFDIDDRVTMVEQYILLGNAREVVRQWSGRNKPTAQTILNTYDRFIETGSVHDREVPIKRKSVLTDDKMEEIEHHVILSPMMSQRLRSIDVTVPKTTLGRALKTLGFKPYHPRLLMDHSFDDFIKRKTFCEDFLTQTAADKTFWERVWWSDECRFTLQAEVNTHNAVYYSRSDPEWDIPVSHSRQSVMVWCGISSIGIIGPIFFDETVMADVYVNLLSTSFLPVASAFDPSKRFILQQDGASSHSANKTVAWLQQNLPKRWIGKDGLLEWPPRSPDLSPVDIFLWGYVKGNVFSTQPRNIDDLKGSIDETIKSITRDTCHVVCHSAVERYTECVGLGGAQVRVGHY